LELYEGLSAWPERARTTRFCRPRRCRSPHDIGPSTAFRATFTAMAIRPLLGAERGCFYAKSEFLETGIFLRTGLDRIFGPALPSIHTNHFRSVLPSKNIEATRSMKDQQGFNLHRFKLNLVSIGIRMLKHNQSGSGLDERSRILCRRSMAWPD